MLADPATAPAARRSYDLDMSLRRIAQSDARGVPLAGRPAELRALRQTGARDLSLGRIFEGHVNAAQLIARCGTAEQRAATDRAIDAGLLFGVWNTQEAPMRIEPVDDGYVLRGAKSWASGAGSIDYPLITAALPDGRAQMCLVPMSAVAARVDASAWRPLGMDASDSFSVDFEGLRLSRSDLIGAPGDYERQPWFFGGALRFAAVQTGGIERLADETLAYLQARGRAADPFQSARIAQQHIARRTAVLWIGAGCRAWEAYDALPTAQRAADVLEAVDIARTVIERAALDTIELAVRGVGARGLVAPEPFAGLVRDLHMYLRQPAPDAALLRVADSAARAPRSFTGAAE